MVNPVYCISMLNWHLLCVVILLFHSKIDSTQHYVRHVLKVPAQRFDTTY